MVFGGLRYLGIPRRLHRRAGKLLEKGEGARVTVHSRGRDRGSSLFRDDDGRDCMYRSLQQTMLRLRGYTCDGPQKNNGNVRDLPVETAGAAYLWSNYYAGGAAVGKSTAMSGTCWLRLPEQHTDGVTILRWSSSSRRDNSNVRDLLVCDQGATFKWIVNLYTLRCSGRRTEPEWHRCKP